MFAQFTDPRVVELFAQLPPPDEIITTEVEELAPSAGCGRRAAAVLLGDAVHAMTPNIGQGAGMAMEDAAVLAEELASSSDIEHALEQLRGAPQAARRNR